MCSFHHEPLHTGIKTNVDKFAFSSHATLIIGTQALRSYLRLTCEYEHHTLQNAKVSTAKDHGENYIKNRLPLVYHLFANLLNHLLRLVLKWLAYFCTLSHYRRNLLNSDWLLWLRYIPNFILTYPQKNPKLLSLVILEAILEHQDDLSTCLDIFH